MYPGLGTVLRLELKHCDVKFKLEPHHVCNNVLFIKVHLTCGHDLGGSLQFGFVLSCSSYTVCPEEPFLSWPGSSLIIGILSLPQML